ncbi:MAG: hypothetical protein R2701_07910 [Acidimicrobiales bacterium]
MTDRPTLALLSGAGASARSVPLLGLLGRHADVVSWHRRGDASPDAVLVTSVDLLPELADADADADVPVGVWIHHHDEIDRALGAGVAVVLTTQAELVARGAVLVPAVGIEVDRWPMVAPVVRARGRLAAGLPERHVVHVEPGSEPDGGDRALALASAVVVSGPPTLLALALGAPTVTSADTARRLGARPGRDVEVASSAQHAAAIAEEIAADDTRAASLSVRARRCAEHHLDLGRPAQVVASRLGLDPSTASAAGSLVDRRLGELRTPAPSPVRRRAAAAVAVLQGDGEGSSA